MHLSNLRRVVLAVALTASTFGLAAPSGSSGTSQVKVVNTDLDPAVVRVTRMPEVATVSASQQSFALDGQMPSHTYNFVMSSTNQVRITHISARITLPAGQKPITSLVIKSGGVTTSLVIPLVQTMSGFPTDFYDASIPVGFVIDANAELQFLTNRWGSTSGTMNGYFTLIGEAL